MDSASGKPGWQTTEFWITLAGQAANLFAAVKGFIPVPYAGLISVIGTAVYTVARTVAKAVADWHDVQSTGTVPADTSSAAPTPAPAPAATK